MSFIVTCSYRLDRSTTSFISSPSTATFTCTTSRRLPVYTWTGSVATPSLWPRRTTLRLESLASTARDRSVTYTIPVFTPFLCSLCTPRSSVLLCPLFYPSLLPLMYTLLLCSLLTPELGQLTVDYIINTLPSLPRHVFALSFKWEIILFILELSAKCQC